MLRIAAFLIIIGGSLAAGPASAQFGNLFGDSPPRPPADIPGGAQPSSPDYPGQAPAPGQQPAPYPGQQTTPGHPAEASPGQPAPPYPGQPAPAPPAQPAEAYPGQPPPAPPGQPAYPGQPAPPYPGQPAQAYPGQPAPGPSSPAVEEQALPPPPGAGTPGQAYPSQPADKGYPPPAPAPRQALTQPNPHAAPAAPAAGAAASDDDTVVEKPTAHIDNKRAVFVGLDKITGRTIKFDAAIGETVQFGALQVTPRACYTRPPTEATNTDAFVEVDEVTLKGDIKRIFTGWMFASSPGLNAVDHPIYDVWLIDCASPVETTLAQPPAPPAAAERHPATRRRGPPARQPVEPEPVEPD